MKRSACLLALLPVPLAAHMVSMSTGDLKVDGARASYELRMPMYEVAHVHDPQHTLLDHVRFESGGVWGKPSGAILQAGAGHVRLHGRISIPRPRGNRERGMHPRLRHRPQSRAPAAGLSRRQNRTRPCSIFPIPRRKSASVRRRLSRRRRARSRPDSCARPADWRRCCFWRAWFWRPAAAAN